MSWLATGMDLPEPAFRGRQQPLLTCRTQVPRGCRQWV